MFNGAQRISKDHSQTGNENNNRCKQLLPAYRFMRKKQRIKLSWYTQVVLTVDAWGMSSELNFKSLHLKLQL